VRNPSKSARAASLVTAGSLRTRDVPLQWLPMILSYQAMNFCHCWHSPNLRMPNICAHTHIHTHIHTHTHRLFCVRFPTSDLTEYTHTHRLTFTPYSCQHVPDTRQNKVLSKYGDILFGGDSDLSGNSVLARVKFYFASCLLVRRWLLFWQKGGSCTKDGHCCL
jgi:hypothetical protein